MRNRRQFLAASAGLAAGLLGCRSKPPAEPPIETTFYGDLFDSFSTALYGELRKDAGNLFVSPYSISTALAMTAEGARGTTLQQMQSVLGLPADASITAALAAKAKPANLASSKSYELAVANALWAQSEYPWSADYLQRVTETFRATVRNVNFTKDPEAARKEINRWVEEQTRNKIQELLLQGMIDTMTRLVLTNAVYFKGDWETAFEVSKTQPAPFTLLDGTKADVPLMHRDGKIDYFQDEKLQTIRLPYKGGEISFFALMPLQSESFADFDANFKASDLAVIAGKMTKIVVSLWLPKFKVELRFALAETLKHLGMPDAFDGFKADFRGMHTGPDQLFISHVEHKAFVEVNEEGTVAAAATAVVMTKASGKPYFRADRPFLFALRHEPTGTLLFLGRFVKPG